MNSTKSVCSARPFFRTLAACVIAVAATVTYAATDAGSEAAPEPLAGATVADLEKAFWACDYTATTRGVQATPVEICALATDELKRVKFGGSLADLLAWWQVNKAIEHRALADTLPAQRE